MSKERYPRARGCTRYQQPQGWTGGRLWWLPWAPKGITLDDVLMAVLAILTIAVIAAGGI